MINTRSTNNPAKTPKERSISDVIPLYFSVYLVLHKDITEGKYPDGVALPSEQELAKRFGVSRVTIRRTMLLLGEADMIVRQRGRGTFANPSAIKKSESSNFSGLTENIKAFEEETSVRILEYAPAEPPEWVLTAAGSENAGPMLKVVRVRSTASQSFSYSVCYVPYPEANLLSVESLSNRTIMALLEAEGAIAKHVDQRLTAVAATPEIAGLLGINVGEPLVTVRRLVRDSSNRLIEAIQVFYRPDSFEYQVSLYREATLGEAPRWVSSSTA
ncbi:GntR family transcriptional regulator [Limibacillus sp. MBR-115]|jgi:GntR family transcriptional regulator|uniref:GntR family transcriptional regulator n=1 Tax=Limibacillus sp. MBR-115 TaxID=3156465 RepID=UPI003399FEDF